MRLAHQLLDELQYSRHEWRVRDERRYWYDVITGRSSAYWISLKEDMGRVAQVFPEVTFRVTVIGEDRDDYSRLYFRGSEFFETNGKVTYEEPPFEF